MTKAKIKLEIYKCLINNAVNEIDSKKIVESVNIYFDDIVKEMTEIDIKTNEVKDVKVVESPIAGEGLKILVSSSQRKAIYFNFYSQLPQSIAEEAMEEYNDEFAKEEELPKTISQAILRGFYWGKSKKEDMYWSNIYEKY